MDHSIYVGPYLEITAVTEEVREDLCRRKGSCVDPDPRAGRYCSGCGLDLGGMYVEPNGRTDGRYRFSMKVLDDPKEIIADVEGYDVDSFTSGTTLPPVFIPEQKRFKNDGKKHFTIHPNRKETGAIHVGSNRVDSTTDLTDVDIGSILTEFEDRHATIIEALRGEFDEVGTRYGVLVSWG